MRLGGMGSGRVSCGFLDIGQKIDQFYAMQTVSYSEARENLKAVMDKAFTDRAPILVTRQRGENAVIVSASEWASIEETLHLLRSPRNAERLLAAVRGLEAGGGEEHELIDP